MFTAVMVTVLSAALLLLFVYRFIWNEQLGRFHTQAAGLNQKAEQILRNAQQWVTVGLSDVYASKALTDDMFFMLQSGSLEDYLQKRREKSVSDQAHLRSVPEYFHSRVRIQESALRKVAFRGQGGESSLYFSDNDAVYAFREPYRPGESSVSQNIVFQQAVYNTFSQDDAQGDIIFYFETSRLFQALELGGTAVSAAALTDGQGGVYFLTGQGAYTEELFQSAAASENGTGSLPLNLNRVYYNNFDYVYFPYRLTVLTDSAYFLADVRDWLIIMSAGILAIAFGFIFLFMANIREDKAFLRRIYASIATMKQGVFKPGLPAPRKYRANEYGEIARELDDLSGRLQKHIQTEYELKIIQREAEMKSLLNQISPHFLYNTLEVIRSKAAINDDAATADSIAALGLFYRSFMQTPEFCEIKDELNLLEAYLKVIGFRFPNQFYYQISADPKLLPVPTVKAWMQPLAENFITHGFDKESEYNLLIITGTAEKDGFRVEMTDNGKTVPESGIKKINEDMLARSEKETVGLANVYERLRLFYGEKFGMELCGNPEGGLRVSIFLPDKSE
ncbi:MAG: histidine kinase [Clostridiales bacterium]|jgi:sensor histidine kinase YesM|nr:histidine kinase [Clostridiales bacterium]